MVGPGCDDDHPSSIIVVSPKGNIRPILQNIPLGSTYYKPTLLLLQRSITIHP